MERKVLQAKDGFVFTNGEIYGDTIYLADGVDETTFKEIPKDELVIDDIEEADIDDYKESLSKFGVDVDG